MTFHRYALAACIALAALAPVRAATPAASIAVDEAARTVPADTPAATPAGTRFTVPRDWSMHRQGPMVVLGLPEGGSRIGIVDVDAADADAAVAAAWAMFRPGPAPVPRLATDGPLAHGWTVRRDYSYDSPVAQARFVGARAYRAGARWTAVVGDIALALIEKRNGQFGQFIESLAPSDVVPESFAGKRAHVLDAARIATLKDFIDAARKALGVPGVSVGIVQGGRVVLGEGFGVRRLGEATLVDAQTLYLVASNTKPLATLMLAKLVGEGRFDWDTPVVKVMPGFALGDAATTAQVRVRHLVCACTGMPRQDMDWLFDYEGKQAADAMRALAGMQPTSPFGALFQYSNHMAAAGGYVGGHAAYPAMELGAAFDAAIQSRVFDPLGMRATTFDFDRVLAGNHASPHAGDFDGRPAVAAMDLNRSIVPVRPAGGAWSNVDDLLRYVRMELDGGLLPDGTRYIDASLLAARQAPQASAGDRVDYGMGLFVDRSLGTPIVSHGGSMIGYKSEMFWLPEHGVGAVLLANSDEGQLLREPFRRRLLEVLFDAAPQAQANVAAIATAMHAAAAARRQRWQRPVDPAIAGRLASRYANPRLGEVRVERSEGGLVLDMGGWHSAMASRVDEAGTAVLTTVDPGTSGFDFELAPAPSRALVLRDQQHTYALEPVE